MDGTEVPFDEIDMSLNREGAMETLLRELDIGESTILDLKSQGITNLWLLLTASDTELRTLGISNSALKRLRSMESQATQQQQSLQEEQGKDAGTTGKGSKEMKTNSSKDDPISDEKILEETKRMLESQRLFQIISQHMHSPTLVAAAFKQLCVLLKDRWVESRGAEEVSCGRLSVGGASGVTLQVIDGALAGGMVEAQVALQRHSSSPGVAKFILRFFAHLLHHVSSSLRLPTSVDDAGSPSGQQNLLSFLYLRSATLTARFAKKQSFLQELHRTLRLCQDDTEAAISAVLAINSALQLVPIFRETAWSSGLMADVHTTVCLHLGHCGAPAAFADFAVQAVSPSFHNQRHAAMAGWLETVWDFERRHGPRRCYCDHGTDIELLPVHLGMGSCLAYSNELLQHRTALQDVLSHALACLEVLEGCMNRPAVVCWALLALSACLSWLREENKYRTSEVRTLQQHGERLAGLLGTAARQHLLDKRAATALQETVSLLRMAKMEKSLQEQLEETAVFLEENSPYILLAPMGPAQPETPPTGPLTDSAVPISSN